MSKSHFHRCIVCQNDYTCSLNDNRTQDGESVCYDCALERFDRIQPQEDFAMADKLHLQWFPELAWSPEEADRVLRSFMTQIPQGESAHSFCDPLVPVWGFYSQSACMLYLDPARAQVRK